MLIVQGWTEGIEYQLTADGAPQDLLNLTVALELTPQYKTTPKALGGSVVITDSPNGKVTFTPLASDLLSSESPYSMRWRVTDTSGDSAFFPREQPELWYVQLP